MSGVRQGTTHGGYAPDTIHDDLPDWQASALCAQVDASDETWFIDKGASSAPAKEICALCEFRAPCLADAMRAERGLCATVRYGIYAGLTPKERAQLHDSGWQPGDPMPEIRVRRTKFIAGPCPYCGKETQTIAHHIGDKHQDTRRKPAA